MPQIIPLTSLTRHFKTKQNKKQIQPKEKQSAYYEMTSSKQVFYTTSNQTTDPKLSYIEILELPLITMELLLCAKMMLNIFHGLSQLTPTKIS